jgi:hypothetical protein
MKKFLVTLAIVAATATAVAGCKIDNREMPGGGGGSGQQTTN